GQTMRQRFFIENKPGAGSNTAAVGVAKGEADGYTLFLGSAANAISASVKASSVDLKNDLKPIALLCSLPNILVVHSSLKATTVKDLIALARAEPGKLNYGSAGAGTSLHLSMELFKNMAGIDIVHVPYTGSPQAMQDLIGGRLHMMFSPASTALPQIEAGYLRPLAWSSATRGRSLPDSRQIYLVDFTHDFAPVSSLVSSLVPVSSLAMACWARAMLRVLVDDAPCIAQ